MKIHCVAIDDEPLALNIIENHINQIPCLELSKKFTNALEAIDYLQSNPTDLLFIDIEMPDITGFEIISRLKTKPLIIFTTAFSEYAIDGFKADAIDYLLKPIDFPDFQRAIQKAKDLIQLKSDNAQKVKSNKEFLFIKSEYKIIRINFQDIIYIQGMSEYVKIHLTNAKPIMSLISMKSLEAQLPEEMFMRIHKSYIVNLNKINMIERAEIVYDDGTTIPISQQYKSKFQEFVEKNFLM